MWPGGITAHVQAITDRSAHLPCDLTPASPNDTVVLVVWYKDEHTPIYSYDTRGPKKPMLWRDDNTVGARATFLTITNPATLSIQGVRLEDEGEYRCRIDYMRSPTKNLRVKLTVIVLPGKPKILDEHGKEVTGQVGPYEEGGDVKLTCVVSGGKPRPTIKWWREGKLLEAQEAHYNFGVDRATTLTVRGLRRDDLNAEFTCQASNNNMSQPTSTTVAIDIYFRPLSVEILSSNNPFSADRRYEIPCQTFGSKPQANITWSIDGKELPPSQYDAPPTTSNPDLNATTSILVFTPARQDNGRTLTCRATNEKVQNGIEETNIILNVYYVPILHLTLGSNLNPEDIEEGDDVYFECRVNANPVAYKVLWKHNGQVMQANQKGVIMSEKALALQGVKRAQSGNYSCVASNVEGDGDSNIVHLKIMYKPICRPEQKRIYGVARHEEAKVICQVEAYPAPDSFTWSVNNSAENVEKPTNRYHQGAHHFSSTFTFKPINELDYGTVMCWASNLAGRQQEPCIFHVIAAGKPDPPQNCSLANHTNDAVEVECVEGFDGGQPQNFFLEVYDEDTNVLQANVSNKFPIFIVSGLDAGRSLKMMVYAVNAKGRSEGIRLEGFTLKVAEKQTVLNMDARDQLEVAPILGILVGIVTVLLLVTVVILGALKVRAAHRDGSRALRPGFLPVKEKATVPLRSESEDLFEKDDKNPDLIPSNKDSDYQLGSAAQTPGLNNSGNVSTASGAYISTSPLPSPPMPSAPPAAAAPTPLAEAYMARDRGVPPSHTNNEVTYAELSLARPTTLDALAPQAVLKNGGQHYAALRARPDEPTVYAQIDHGRRPPPPPPTAPPGWHHAPAGAAAPPPPTAAQPLFAPPVAKAQYHREVVTVRTPLMGCQQESCV